MTDIAVCLALSLCANAAEAQAQSLVPDSAIVLRDAEVTASAPGSVSKTAPVVSIDIEQMERHGVADVADAVRRMPGVQLRDYGGAGGLKTVSARGFGASHTAVVYDGIALGDAQSGQIDISRYSIDNVRSLSLAMGDNDDIFTTARAAASAAVLSITSFSRADSLQFEAQIKAGSFGLVNPFAKLGVPLGPDASITAVADFAYADNNYPFTLVNGQTVTKERRTNSWMRQGHGEINFNWNPSNASVFKAKAYYFDSNRRLPGQVIYYNNENHEALRNRDVFAQAQYRCEIGGKWSVMANAKWSYQAQRYSDVSGIYPGGLLDQRYWQREYYASVAVLWTPAPAWAIDYSADYTFSSLNSNIPRHRRPSRHSILQSIAARYRRGRVSAMVRGVYSIYDNLARNGKPSADESRLSPSASVSVRLLSHSDLFARVSYKNIFRIPTFSEAYFDHYGSEELLPETVDQLNVGLSYAAPSTGWLQSLEVSADAYVNHVRDMIVAVPYNMFVWRMVNMGRARIFGLDASVEAEASLARSQTLSLMGSLSVQRAQPRTNPESSDWNKQVAYIPICSGSASLAWENPWVNASISGVGVGERYTTSNNVEGTRMDPYFELSASLWRQFRVRKCQFTLRIDAINILNEQYEIVAKYPMPGRSWRATIRFEL